MSEFHVILFWIMSTAVVGMFGLWVLTQLMVLWCTIKDKKEQRARRVARSEAYSSIIGTEVHWSLGGRGGYPRENAGDGGGAGGGEGNDGEPSGEDWRMRYYSLRDEHIRQIRQASGADHEKHMTNIEERKKTEAVKKVADESIVRVIDLK